MAGFRLIRPDTAFANASARGQKRPRKEEPRHLEWLRTLPCVITRSKPVDAAHIRYEDRAYGKRQTGGQEKPDDRWCLPLCREKHDEHHSGNEKLFWLRHGLDPCKIALALHNVTGDDEQAFVILREAWAVAHAFDASRLGDPDRFLQRTGRSS